VLSLPMGEAEFDALAKALDEVLGERAELLRAIG
jgi:hypothetical protein